MANINTAINGIMTDVGAIGKDRKNQQQGFMYRGVDEVMNALQPALVRHKVYVVPEVLEQIREERTSKNGGLLLYSILKVKFTFYADDGSSVSATVIGEGMDSADKASNKAMSVAFKYACFQVFCIPTEEMADPDADTHEVAPTMPKKTSDKALSDNIVKQEADAEKLRILSVIDTLIQTEQKKGKKPEGIINGFILGTSYETKKKELTDYTLDKYGINSLDELNYNQLRDVLYQTNIKAGKIK